MLPSYFCSEAHNLSGMGNRPRCELRQRSNRRQILCMAAGFILRSRRHRRSSMPLSVIMTDVINYSRPRHARLPKPHVVLGRAVSAGYQIGKQQRLVRSKRGTLAVRRTESCAIETVEHGNGNSALNSTLRIGQRPRPLYDPPESVAARSRDIRECKSFGKFRREGGNDTAVSSDCRG